MGPRCPHCDAIYEWTAGELEEHVTAPKVYFCQECGRLFVLDPEEVAEVQGYYQPALQASSSAGNLDDPLLGLDEEEAEEASDPTARDGAEPRFDLRQPVRIASGPEAGRAAWIVGLDGPRVLVLIEGRTRCLRVEPGDVRPRSTH